MKRVFLIARQNITNPNTRTIHSDEGLKSLGGYMEGRIREVPDNYNTHALADDMIAEFEEMHPDFFADCFEIKECNT